MTHALGCKCEATVCCDPSGHRMDGAADDIPNPLPYLAINSAALRVACVHPFLFHGFPARCASYN